MSSLDIPKKVYRDHQTIKKAVKIITTLRTQSKEEGFKDFFLNEHKLKRILHKHF